MRLEDDLRFGIRSLTTHRARAWLTLLAMALGTAAVILLSALGEGARVYVLGEFTQLGTHLVQDRLVEGLPCHSVMSFCGHVVVSPVPFRYLMWPSYRYSRVWATTSSGETWMRASPVSMADSATAAAT